MSMWGKKQDEPMPPAARPASVPPPVAEVKKESAPVSPTSFRSSEPEKASSASIGKGVKINGQIFSKEDLFVDGDVEGTLELHENKLTIGPSGRVQAAIRAREVVVLGQIQGNVEAHDRIDIRKDAKLVGDIKTARIMIEDGAYFKGSIDIVRPEKQAAAAPPPPVAAPPAQRPLPTAGPVPVGAEIKR